METFPAGQFLGSLPVRMDGGAILGEGVDGCVLAEPMWPCAQPTKGIPDPHNKTAVSKILRKTDQESEVLTGAAAILGPHLTSIHLAPLRGLCAPANNQHPPPAKQAGTYKQAKGNVLGWKEEGKACGELRKQLKSGKGIHTSHKIAYIERYPTNLDAWINVQAEIERPHKQVIQDIIGGIRPFLQPLQRLAQHSPPLYNIDLHNQNIFVRPRRAGGIDFGIADFGHALTGNPFFIRSHYLETYIQHYRFYAGFNQVPLEARLLNYCYVKNAEAWTPDTVVKGWATDKDTQSVVSGSADLLMIGLQPIVTTLLQHPLFLQYVSLLQSISRKLKEKQLNSLTSTEQLAVDLILNRYMIVSPMNSILGSIFQITFGRLLAETHVAIWEFSGRQDSQLPSRPLGVYNITEFILNLMRAPYAQTGSSLPSALSAVLRSDATILWDDAFD